VHLFQHHTSWRSSSDSAASWQQRDQRISQEWSRTRRFIFIIFILLWICISVKSVWKEQLDLWRSEFSSIIDKQLKHNIYLLLYSGTWSLTVLFEFHLPSFQSLLFFRSSHFIIELSNKILEAFKHNNNKYSFVEWTWTSFQIWTRVFE
jgi:hypothetical protein